MKIAYFVSFYILFSDFSILCVYFSHTCVIMQIFLDLREIFLIVIFLAIFIKYNILRGEDQKEVNSEVYKHSRKNGEHTLVTINRVE